MEHFGKSGVIKRFEQLDDDLLSIVGDDKRIEITIVGGSALLMLDLVGNTRVTTDIDVMETERLAERFLERYDMNQNVNTFKYRMPENWPDRRQKIPFQGTVLDVYAPSNEDLAILKLCAYRESDKSDLREMILSGELDLARLRLIINDDSELRVNFDDENEWELFLRHYNEIETFAQERKI